MRAGMARTDSSQGDGALPSDHSNSTEKPIQKDSLSLYSRRGHAYFWRFAGMFVCSNLRRRCVWVWMSPRDGI